MDFETAINKKREYPSGYSKKGYNFLTCILPCDITDCGNCLMSITSIEDWQDEKAKDFCNNGRYLIAGICVREKDNKVGYDILYAECDTRLFPYFLSGDDEFDVIP